VRVSARVLFVGEAPTISNVGFPLHPDYCDAGRRLLGYTGWSREEFLRLADRTNLFEHPQERWGPVSARDAATTMVVDDWARYEHVVLLGRRVADSFREVGSAPFFRCAFYGCATSARSRGTRAYVCPHPSGRNRWWNDQNNRRAARRFFNRLATDVWEPPQQSRPVTVGPAMPAGGGSHTTGDKQ